MNGDLLDGVEAAAGLAVYGGARAASHPGRVEFDYPYDLLAEIAELHEELADLDTVVITGRALAADAMARTVGVPLLIDALPGADRLRRTVIVQTEERPAFRQAYLDLGLTPAETDRHFVVLDELFPAGDGPFGPAALVPAALAGVDVAELLDQAREFAANDRPALALAARLVEAALPAPDPEFTGRGVTLRSDGTGLEALGPWIEDQLRGLPLSGSGITVSYGGALPPGAIPGGGIRPDVAVNGPLGAQFQAWRAAVGYAARMLRL